MSDTAPTEPVGDPAPVAEAPGTQEVAEALNTTPADVRAHAEELGGVKEAGKWKFPDLADNSGAQFDEQGMRIYRDISDVAYTVHPLELPTDPGAAARIPDYMIDDSHMSDSPTTGAASVAARVQAGKRAHGLAEDDDSMTGSVLDGEPKESLSE